MKIVIAAAVLVVAVVFGVKSAPAGGKKCTGATPCLACKKCDKCSYCKSGRTCGACSRPLSANPGALLPCEGTWITGPAGAKLLPLPASQEQAAAVFAAAGLDTGETAALDAGGQNREYYRLKYEGNMLTAIESDTVFNDVDAGLRYVDSITKALRVKIVSKEDILASVGWADYREYYLPAVICGEKAIVYAFKFAPDLARTRATLTREVFVRYTPR